MLILWGRICRATSTSFWLGSVLAFESANCSCEITWNDKYFLWNDETRYVKWSLIIMKYWIKHVKSWNLTRTACSLACYSVALDILCDLREVGARDLGHAGLDEDLGDDFVALDVYRQRLSGIFGGWRFRHAERHGFRRCCSASDSHRSSVKIDVENVWIDIVDSWTLLQRRISRSFEASNSGTSPFPNHNQVWGDNRESGFSQQFCRGVFVLLEQVFIPSERDKC